MSLVKIKKDFSPDSNFWEQNPQLAYMAPFSKLYQKDKGKEKDRSSKQMWVIFFMCDPDEDKNKFYRIGYDTRLAMLKETYFAGFNEADELIQECMAAYPERCLTAVEKSLKQEIDSMSALVNYITTIDYESISLDDIKKLVAIRAQTPKVMDNYEKLQAKFMKEKVETRLRGGRKESKSEKKLL